jgi:hypothetical protein
MSSLLALDVDDRAIGDFLVGLPVQASSAQAETTAILRGRPDISTRLTLVKVSGRRESEASPAIGSAAGQQRRINF